MSQVNGVDLRGASHEEAIAALRQTPPKVRLTVLRDGAQYRDEENLDVFTVDLQKKSGRGLGLSIVGKRSALPEAPHHFLMLVREDDSHRVCVCVLGVAAASSSPRWSEAAPLSSTGV